MNKTIKKFIGYLIGITILIILVFKIDPVLLKSVISDINVVFILPVIFFTILSIFIASISIKILLQAKKKIPVFRIFKYKMIEHIGSVFIPLSGSALSLVYLLKKKDNIKIGVSASTLILDKSITFFLSLMIAFFALIKYFGIKIAFNAIYVILAWVLVMYLIFYCKTTRNIVTKFFPKRYLEKISGIRSHYKKIFRMHKKLIILNVFVTLLVFLSKAFKVIFAFKMLGITLGMINAYFITIIAQLAVVLPITPGGIGIRQAMGVYLFSLIGIPLTISIAMYLLVMIIDYSIAAITSFVISHQK